MGERKITLGEMRDSGLSRLLIYCGDYHCAHSVVIDSGRWGDDVRLSDPEVHLFGLAAIAVPMFDRCLSRRAWAPNERKSPSGGS